ncbi:MAG: ABC transporter ATP-binding protein [Nocardioides alkalitolerans]
MKTRTKHDVLPETDERLSPLGDRKAGDPATGAAPAPEPAIRLSGVTKEFGSFRAVDDVSLEIGRGRFVTLVGPSGCGKTTLLRMIAGLESPTSGRIAIAGRTVVGDGVDVPPHQRGLGMVFQSYALWPHLSVLENVAFPLKRAVRGLRPSRGERAEIVERARHALDVVDCGHLLARYPGELSGGQQQRIAVARSIVGEPSVVLMDEPLSNLDARLRARLRYDLREIQQEVGFTAVYVTHDRAEALSMSDTVVVFRAGRVEQQGRPHELHEHPASSYVAEFVGDHNTVAGEVARVDDAGCTVRTVLGDLRGELRPGSRLAVGDAVDTAVSRDDILVVPVLGTPDGEPAGAFTVLGVAYHGWYAEVLLVDAEEREITVRTTPSAAPAVGDRVRLSAERSLLVTKRDAA